MHSTYLINYLKGGPPREAPYGPRAAPMLAGRRAYHKASARRSLRREGRVHTTYANESENECETKERTRANIKEREFRLVDT